ncbi:aTP synthase F1 epsilon subunit [Prevotella sp. CAG:1185]|uniref:ATP synthase F1 subunit epsilon n=1 Tax=uncultured Prevotella sp. TaxID=159272 RepID=UPI00033663CC|nr:ATP synthase F1 subunit epsilon [uncultured Prevotella sp.]CCY80265.1 aTP synthase F1 epsilon subunit [Prevotella sp. CAG:1185]
MSLKLKIVSPEKIEFEGTVDSVLVPGTKGAFEILKDHAPIISSLRNGCVEYAVNGVRNQIQITGGFVEVQKNVVSLCVEIA